MMNCKGPTKNAFLLSGVCLAGGRGCPLSAAYPLLLSFFELIAVGECLLEMSDFICFAEVTLNIIMKGDLKQ